MDEVFQNLQDKGVAFSPREFILKYLKYIPWLILSVAVFIILAYIKLRYSTEVYEVRSKILIKNESATRSQDTKLQDLFLAGGSSNLNDEIEIMKSSGLSKRIVTALNLQTSYLNIGKVKESTLHPKDSPFRLEVLSINDSTRSFSLNVNYVNDNELYINNNKEPIHFGQIIENGYGKMRFVKQAIPAMTFASNEFLVVWQPLFNVAVGISRGFSISPISESSNVLQIIVQTDNTKLGKDIVNQLMEEYNEATVEDKIKTTEYTLEFIDERLDSLKTDLSSVEQNLQNFRQNNRAIDIGQQSLMSFNELSISNQALSSQEVQLKILGYLQNYLTDERNYNKTVPTQLGITEASLQVQIQQYNTAQLKRSTELKTTPAENPLIKELDAGLENLREQMLENLKNIRQGYEINRNNLLQKARITESQISSVPGKTKQLLEITRQQKIFEELYSFLLQKKLETSISLASTISTSKVIEPAQASSTPVTPNRKGLYLLAVFFGLVLPIAIIFLIELMNDKINGRADVERMAKAPILGEIGHSDQSDTLVVSKNSRKFIAEQFRIIRTNLKYILNKIERPVILITSSFSGEGKSFISTNIGAVIALTGKKTVILEFDIRKPKIVAGLDLNRKSGITNYIVGTADIEDMVIPITQVQNLYVIPCGPVPPNPAELLLDEKVKELFKYLRERFDVIIVDSAPVGLVTDAEILSLHADATLYIMRQNYTSKKQIVLINELYNQNKLPKLSLILNDCTQTIGQRTYGGYGYGYGYGSGYFEQEGKVKKTIWQRIKSIFTGN